MPVALQAIKVDDFARANGLSRSNRASALQQALPKGTTVPKKQFFTRSDDFCLVVSLGLGTLRLKYGHLAGGPGLSDLP